MGIRTKGWVGLALLVGTGVAASVPACNEHKGALMLAVATDMKAPGDVNEVTLAVSVDGKVAYVFPGEVAPNGDVYFPATVAITEPENAGAVVRIRVIASKFGEVRVLREAITTVPKDGRVGLLRMPLRFADYGTSGQGTVPTGQSSATLSDGGVATANVSIKDGLVADAWDPFVNVTNLCGANKTSDNGECVDANVDSSTLPEFVESEVFGGGDRSGATATCFDVATCFSGAVPLTPIDPVACTFTKPAGFTQMNVAVAAEGIGEPIAGTTTGLVPLDSGPGGFTDDGKTITIPKVFCKTPDPSKPSPKLKVTGVFASAACAAKTEAATLCGPAFIGSQSGRDAGGGGRLALDASTLPPPEGGQLGDGAPPLFEGGPPIGGDLVGASETAVTALTVFGNKLYFVRGNPPGPPNDQTSYGGVYVMDNSGANFKPVSQAPVGEHKPGTGISIAFGLAAVEGAGRLGWSTGYNDAVPAAAVFNQLGANPARSEGPVAPQFYRGVAASAANLYWLDKDKVDRLDTLNPPVLTMAVTVPYTRVGATFTSFAVTPTDAVFIGRNDGKIEFCGDAGKMTACTASFAVDTTASAGSVLGIAPVAGDAQILAYYVQDGVGVGGLHSAEVGDKQTSVASFAPIAVELGHPYPLMVAGGYVFYARPDNGGSVAYVKIGSNKESVLASNQGTVYSMANDGTFAYWSFGDAQGVGGVRKMKIPPP